jgi:hypothetical protein
MAARVAAGKMPDGHARFEIADESGKTVLVMPFENAIDELSEKGEETPEADYFR